MLKGLGGLGDMAKIMKQAQEMQGKMADAQAKLEELTCQGEAGAGMVKVVMTGRHDVKSVAIDNSVMSEDKDLLEDLLAAAVNDAVRKVETVSQEKMSSVTSGMGLPPGMKLPF